ncbi:MAG: hypothetical protein JW731_14345 [Bacteroidales bacterium]|nr:hypothetical protein [Bacteroidales bacterium]
MLTQEEVKKFSEVSGPEGLTNILNKSNSDLIRMLYAEMHIKNTALSYLVDKGLMNDFSKYK